MMISDSAARGRPEFDHGSNSKSNGFSMPQATCCGRELFSEVLDLATGVGLLTFTLAPLALPALALVAVAAALLMISVLVGASAFTRLGAGHGRARGTKAWRLNPGCVT